MVINQVLNPDSVAQVFERCVSKGASPRWSDILVKGVVTTPSVRFDFKCLEDHRTEIDNMLRELPAGFRSPAPGGSIIDADVDKHGQPWVDTTREEGVQLVERLIQIGLAAHRIFYLLPRADWSTLPGGQPYVRVTM